MNNLWVEKKINENITKKFFKHYELGILGCGKNSVPFFDMTKFVELPDNKQIIADEIKHSLVESNLYNKSSTILPKALNGGKSLVSYYYNFIEHFVDSETLKNFQTHEQFDKFVIENFDCRNWQNLLAPRVTDSWYNKSSEKNCKWNDLHSTPHFKNWIESLYSIFDEIGRVIVFNSKLHTPVLMHRDYFYREHKTHFINFQFSERTNVAYVYDEVKEEKIYINTPCYMFNECDLHGVDACDEERFTVRVDGRFKSIICESLGMNNENVWDNMSLSFSKLQHIKVIEPVFEG